MTTLCPRGYRACKSLGTRCVERGERQRESKQSGTASEASSGVDGRAGSSVREGSLRGVQPSSRFGRRASQTKQCHVAGNEQPVLVGRASVSSLSAGTGFFNHAGGFRGAQPRTPTRAPEVAATVDETLTEFLRQGNWQRGGETTARQEEAWELSQRQPRMGATRREELKYSPFGSSDTDEKSLQAWVEGLLKIALAQDRKEARERQSTGKEDSNSQRRRAWEKIWDPRVLALSPFLAKWTLSRDVRLDVELAALVSSVETTLCSNSLWSVPPTSTHRVHHGEPR